MQIYLNFIRILGLFPLKAKNMTNLIENFDSQSWRENFIAEKFTGTWVYIFK